MFALDMVVFLFLFSTLNLGKNYNHVFLLILDAYDLTLVCFDHPLLWKTFRRGLIDEIAKS